MQQYPTLNLADVYAVLGYYLRHRDAIDAYLARRQQDAERVRQETLARSGVTDVRERLLSRRSRNHE